MPTRLILVALLAVWSAPPVQATETGAPADRTAELRRLTQQRFDANTDNDRSFYERLLAPNFVALDRNNPPQTRKEYLDGEFLPRSAGHRGGRATITDFRALVDGNTAVASYQAVEPTPLGEQQFEARSTRVDTYALIKGAWRLLSMAVADLPSWPDVAVIDSQLYSEYAGTYQLSPDVFIFITNEAGHLMLEQTALAKAELLPENTTSFFDKTDSPLARTVFERDASGRVVAVIYRASGQQVRARKIK